jgi:hypothetical protein
MRRVLVRVAKHHHRTDQVGRPVRTPNGSGTAALAAVLLALLAPGLAQGVEIGPSADWCREINDRADVHEFVLQPGEYEGPCAVLRGGSAELPLVIRAKDPANPARIVYLGASDNVLNLRASHVTLAGLAFGPTRLDVDAIRVHAGDGLAIEDCRFDGLGGIAVAATSASVRQLVIRRNVITRSSNTGMYLGCHDGRTCAHAGLVIESNFIHGVDAPDASIGYGIQVKLNSAAVIRDNVIVDTKGPGIMVYGAHDPSRVSLVERNFVAGSRASSAIVVGGGPAVIRNNVATTSAEAGIALEDYGGRGLLRDVVIIHNTVFDNGRAGIKVPRDGRVAARILNNAIHARGATPILPATRADLTVAGNVNCTRLPCFVDPVERDFSPLVIRPGAILAEVWTPIDDYFGRRRGPLPVPGAIEDVSGPITFGPKALHP